MNTILDFFNSHGSHFTLVKMLVPCFMAILFLQSGFNKAFDYKGNLDYFTDHFKNSPLSKTVGLLMPTITILEIAAGITSAVGVIALIFGSETWAFYGLLLAALDFLCLFFGQRLAKDYGGAASLSSYFAVNVIGLLLLL